MPQGHNGGGMRAHGWLALVAVMAIFSSAWRYETNAAVPIDQRSIPLKPGTTFVTLSFLTGEIRDLRVVEHVERASGRLVGVPLLRGMLTIQNDSFGNTAHLIAGKIVYVNAEGQHVALPAGAGETTFPIIGSAADRLDPGQQISLAIAVPFPTTGLMPNRIHEVGLELTYTSLPYRQNTVTFPVTLGAPQGDRGSPGRR